MKLAYIIALLTSFAFANNGALEVVSFESADLNNNGGAVTKSFTNITQVKVEDGYISLQGFDNGKQIGRSYSTTSKEMHNLDSGIFYKYLIIEDGYIYCIIYQLFHKLTIINTKDDKMEIYHLRPLAY